MLGILNDKNLWNSNLLLISLGIRFLIGSFRCTDFFSYASGLIFIIPVLSWSIQMASVAVYSTRSRINERVGRLKKDLDRSSAYTLSNLVRVEGKFAVLFMIIFEANFLFVQSENSLMGKYSKSSYASEVSGSSSMYRSPRDSSIGALGRSSK